MLAALQSYCMRLCEAEAVTSEHVHCMAQDLLSKAKVRAAWKGIAEGKKQDPGNT